MSQARFAIGPRFATGLRFAAAAGTALLISGASTGDRPTFAPGEGSELTTSFTYEMDFALDDLSIVVDGEDVGAMIGTPDMEFIVSAEIQLVDTFIELSDSRPTVFEREIDVAESNTDMSISVMGEGDEQSTSNVAQLAGHKLRFEWEDGEYAVAFADDDAGGDEELLENVEAEAFLRRFLPESNVEEGESWDVDGEALLELGMPGGDLGWIGGEIEGLDGADMEEIVELMEPLMEDAIEMTKDFYDGGVIATYAGVREDDSMKLAEIALEFELDKTIDISELISSVVDSIGEMEELPEDFFFETNVADISVTGEGEGTLLWNLERGVAHSFDATIDFDFGIELGFAAGAMGESADVELSMEMSGTYVTQVETE